MIYALAPLVALAGSAVASYQDIKTREISNVLTLSLIATGLLFYGMRVWEEGNAILWVPLAATFAIIWLMWRAGMWGGGDAKLVMGICALASSFHGVFFIPLFFIMIAAVALVHYFIFGLIEEMKRGKGKRFVLAVALIAGVSSVSYLITDMLFPPLSLFVSLTAFFISADIMSSRLPCKKRVPVSEQLVGEPLAETIGLRDNRVVRIEREMSLIKRLLKREREDMDEVLVAPSHLGISDRDVAMLKKCCREVTVVVTYPMAPLIFVALTLTLAAEMAGFSDIPVFHV